MWRVLNPAPCPAKLGEGIWNELSHISDNELVHQAKEFLRNCIHTGPMSKIWHKLGIFFFFYDQCILYHLKKVGKGQQDGLTTLDKLCIREASPLMRTHSDTSGPPVFLQETQYGFGDVKHVCEFLSKTQVAGKSRCNSIKHWNFVFRETKVSNKPNPK